MIAGPFDDRDRAGVADREPFAGNAAEIAFAGDRAIERGIADDDRFLRGNPRQGRGINDDVAAREPLADVIVGLALEFQGDAGGKPRAETLPGGPLGSDMDRVARKPGMAITARDGSRQHGARGAVGVVDRGLDSYSGAGFNRGLGRRDQLAIQHFFEPVILPGRMKDRLTLRWRLVEELREIKPARLPMVDRLLLVEHLNLSDHLVDGAIAHRCHQSAHFLGNKEKEIDHMLGLTGEPLAQNRVLRRNADRTGV